jgi:hypothetical protein
VEQPKDFKDVTDKSYNRDSPKIGIEDCAAAKARARAVGGLLYYKICLGTSLEPQPRGACQILLHIP